MRTQRHHYFGQEMFCAYFHLKEPSLVTAFIYFFFLIQIFLEKDRETMAMFSNRFFFFFSSIFYSQKKIYIIFLKSKKLVR